MTPVAGAPVRSMKEAAAALGVRAVLLAYWGTASTLARWFAKPRRGGDESVRPKA